MNEHDQQICAQILAIGARMYAKNMVVANDGNISARTNDGIWTTPTGVCKGDMTQEMLVKVDMSGHVLSGSAKPSSELKMHLRVYAENPQVQAVVHAHPPIATSFAIAGIPLDSAILPEAIVNLGVVPVAPYAVPGTQAVPDSIAPYCRTHNAVLLANHGALTWGRDLWQAYFRMESLEYYATVTMNTGYILRQARMLTPEEIQASVATRERLGITTGGTPHSQG